MSDNLKVLIGIISVFIIIFTIGFIVGYYKARTDLLNQFIIPKKPTNNRTTK